MPAHEARRDEVPHHGARRGEPERPPRPQHPKVFLEVQNRGHRRVVGGGERRGDARRRQRVASPVGPAPHERAERPAHLDDGRFPTDGRQPGRSDPRADRPRHRGAHRDPAGFASCGGGHRLDTRLSRTTCLDQAPEPGGDEHRNGRHGEEQKPLQRGRCSQEIRFARVPPDDDLGGISKEVGNRRRQAHHHEEHGEGEPAGTWRSRVISAGRRNLLGVFVEPLTPGHRATPCSTRAVVGFTACVSVHTATDATARSTAHGSGSGVPLADSSNREPCDEPDSADDHGDVGPAADCRRGAVAVAEPPARRKQGGIPD